MIKINNCRILYSWTPGKYFSRFYSPCWRERHGNVLDFEHSFYLANPLY